MSHLRIFQNNINGFYSKAQILEINLCEEQPHICLLQEGFRSKPKDTEHHFQFLYNHFWSETGRTVILCRKDLHSTQRTFSTNANNFNILGYESCWVEVSCPAKPRPIVL